MQTPKWLLVAGLALTTAVLASCDNNDSRLTDADVLCLKIQQKGGTCPGQQAAGSSTSTVTLTQTTTQTQTNTNTVTVTNANTSN